ncbi:hypothetical protein [Halobacterium wangiae]|uniref:hypothetical protein n=1 Tax=Halobacterium wangiae TaxID=2902623 RepID=UPI001E61A969|nr:hypothetical protein [Halobacterium wangiae]
MVSRPSTPAVVIGLGVLLLLVSAVPVGDSSESTEFVHRVAPAENGTLVYGIEYEAGDVRAYESLSERGQAIFDRARADSPYVVTNQSMTAPGLEYASDHITLGKGVYAVEYDGEVYSLRTQRNTPGFNPAALLVGFATRTAFVLGVVLVTVGLLSAGSRRYGQ